MPRLLRYFAPNLVTSLGVIFGLCSMVATLEHRFVDAAWLITGAVMLDRVDGLVARALNATSPFGIQMDSFADAVNFGVAPSMLVFVSLSSVPALGFDHGLGRGLLMVACALWVLANIFRLAKFNVVVEEAGPDVFFGIPTTLAAGLLVIWILVLHKYSPMGGILGTPESFTGPRLFGELSVGLSAWSYLPAGMLLGAFLMASNLPQPKLGPSSNKLANAGLMLGALSGFIFAFIRFMPDYMALLPTTWTLGALAWSVLSPKARGFKTPSFLPDVRA